MNEYIYAEKWVERADMENDYFDKFVYSYFALNALYNRYYKDKEKNAIKELFYNCFNWNSEFRNKMYMISNMKEFKYFINRKAIKNCRYNPEIENSGSKDTSYFHDKLNSDKTSVKNHAMLMILYQIRCNLFHGNKEFYNIDDQEIMKNASILLVEYMKAFVECR